MAHTVRSNLLALALLALRLLFESPAVSAETIEAGHLGCLFADAVRAANTNEPVGNCRAGDPGHDHIYVHGTQVLLEPPVLITEDLAIVGERGRSTLDGQGRFGFFHVGPGIKLHLQDLLMSNGYGTRATGQARLDSGAGIWFSSAQVINCAGVEEIVAADDATIHVGHAASVCGKAEPFNPHPPVIPPPPDDPQADTHDIRPDSKDEQARQQRNGKVDRRSELKRFTCEHLPDYVAVRAAAGTRSGIQCQALDASGVGIQAVIDRGVIAAVDVWGYVEPGVEVCLRGQGSLLFLDAAFAPRPFASILAQRQGDMTCASFSRAGSLVLVGADDTRAYEIADHCAVRATAPLNLRNEPAGNTILGVIPEGATLAVATRQPGWLEVMYYRARGWVSANYVEAKAGCI